MPKAAADKTLQEASDGVTIEGGYFRGPQYAGFTFDAICDEVGKFTNI